MLSSYLVYTGHREKGKREKWCIRRLRNIKQNKNLAYLNTTFWGWKEDT